MKILNNPKLKMISLVSIVGMNALFCIGGVLAWFTANRSVNNNNGGFSATSDLLDGVTMDIHQVTYVNNDETQYTFNTAPTTTPVLPEFDEYRLNASETGLVVEFTFDVSGDSSVETTVSFGAVTVNDSWLELEDQETTTENDAVYAHNFLSNVCQIAGGTVSDNVLITSGTDWVEFVSGDAESGWDKDESIKIGSFTFSPSNPKVWLILTYYVPAAYDICMNTTVGIDYVLFEEDITFTITQG